MTIKLSFCSAIFNHICHINWELLEDYVNFNIWSSTKLLTEINPRAGPMKAQESPFWMDNQQLRLLP